MKHLLLAGLMSVSFNALAGDKGNGGDAVVCRDAEGKVLSAELLDYYEGRTKRDILASSRIEEEPREYLKEVSAKIESWDKRYEGALMAETTFLQSAIEEHLKSGEMRVRDVIFTNDTLEDIPDSLHLTFPKGCKVEQLAIRQEKIFSQDPVYTINAEILSHLSERDVVGLVLHESIYKFFAQNLSHENSVNARYLNQHLSMHASAHEFNFIHYARAMRDLKMKLLLQPIGFQEAMFVTIRENINEDLVMASFDRTPFDRTLEFNVVFNSRGEIDQETANFGSAFIKVSDGPAQYEIRINHQAIRTHSDDWCRFKMGSNLLEFDLKNKPRRKKSEIMFYVDGQRYEVVVNTKLTSVLKLRVEVELVNGKIVTKVEQVK